MTSGIGATTSGDIRGDYMNLLIAQLQNQNPMEPMDNKDMSAQLTMLSQLEQLESMKVTFAQVLESQETTQAAGLIGKTVSFYGEDSENVISAKVDAVVTVEGEPRIIAGGYELELDGILSIADSETVGGFQGVDPTEWLGKEISFLPHGGDYVNPLEGTVERVETVNGQTYLIVNDYKVAPDEIRSVGLNE